MKFTCEKEELQRLISVVSRLATTRATLPILQNIFLSVKKNKLIVKATDLEQTLEAEVVGDGEEDGIVTVPARVFLEYLQNNTDQKITLTTNDLTLIVESVNHHAKIKGMAAEDYPDLPSITFQAETTCASTVLLEAINKTLFAAANDETRPILTGLLCRFTGDKVTIVGTDGYRLAYSTITVGGNLTGDYIIPKRSLQELTRLLTLDEEVGLAFSASQARFRLGSVTFITRVLDGAFPNYEGIIPKTAKTTLPINSQTLLQSLKLASLFSRDSAFSTKLEFGPTKLKITAISPTLGENANEIAITGGPEELITISLNAQYLIDALGAMTGDVAVSIIDAKSPVMVKLPKNTDYLYLLMPLRSE